MATWPFSKDSIRNRQAVNAANNLSGCTRKPQFYSELANEKASFALLCSALRAAKWPFGRDRVRQIRNVICTLKYTVDYYNTCQQCCGRSYPDGS